MPMVPMRLGDINVTIHAVTTMGKYSVTRTLNVDVSILVRLRGHKGGQ